MLFLWLPDGAQFTRIGSITLPFQLSRHLIEIYHRFQKLAGFNPFVIFALVSLTGCACIGETTMKKPLISLLVIALGLHFPIFSAATQSQSLKALRGQHKIAPKPKLAPDLEEMLAQDDQQALTLGQMRQNRLALKARPSSVGRQHAGDCAPGTPRLAGRTDQPKIQQYRTGRD
jgi:hypothetical protein